MGKYWQLVKSVADSFSTIGSTKYGAAIAYYSIFSLSPLVLITVSISGMVFGRDAVEGRLYGELAGTVGKEGAALIQALTADAKGTSGSIISTILSIAVIMLGASGVLGCLQDALDEIWNDVPENIPWYSFLKRRFLSVAMVVTIGFIFLISLIFSAAISTLSEYTKNHLFGGSLIAWSLDIGFSLVINTVLFSCMYRILPTNPVPIKEAVTGGFIASLMFSLGKIIMGLYLGNVVIESSYGAAGALVIILFWIYYSSQIVILSAIFSRQIYHPNPADYLPRRK